MDDHRTNAIRPAAAPRYLIRQRFTPAGVLGLVLLLGGPVVSFMAYVQISPFTPNNGTELVTLAGMFATLAAAPLLLIGREYEVNLVQSISRPAQASVNALAKVPAA